MCIFHSIDGVLREQTNGIRGCANFDGYVKPRARIHNFSQCAIM
jgi:hypothetical protein